MLGGERQRLEVARVARGAEARLERRPLRRAAAPSAARGERAPAHVQPLERGVARQAERDLLVARRRAQGLVEAARPGAVVGARRGPLQVARRPRRRGEGVLRLLRRARAVRARPRLVGPAHGDLRGGPPLHGAQDELRRPALVARGRVQPAPHAQAARQHQGRDDDRRRPRVEAHGPQGAPRAHADGHAPGQHRAPAQVALEVAGQLARRLVAGPPVLAQGREAHLLEVGRGVGAERSRRRRLLVLHPRRDLLDRLPAEGERARQRHVEHDPEGPHVGGGGEGAQVARDLLGRHVDGRADQVALARERARRVVEARQAEVGDPRLAVGADQHVRRLEVAVQDAARVRVVHGVGDPRQEVDGAVERQGAAVEQVLERGPGDEVHGEERDPLVDAVAVDGDDVPAREARQRAGLALEALARVGVVVADDEDLERHVAPALEVAGAEDHAHVPAGDLARDLEVRPALPRAGEGLLAPQGHDSAVLAGRRTRPGRAYPSTVGPAPGVRTQRGRCRHMGL
ncbi:MAG: hypothetical protein M9894_09950 [Planctomycetes bacterium]|nr:hypothetical protein [Planctomycetota bacterium]